MMDENIKALIIRMQLLARFCKKKIKKKCLVIFSDSGTYQRKIILKCECMIVTVWVVSWARKKSV